MSKPVLLLTDRPAFEEAWRPALERSGLQVQAAAPGAPLDSFEGRVIAVDAGAAAFDEDELLAQVGLARALKITCLVVLPDDDRLSGLQELLEDLCPGFVTRGVRDATRCAAALARRADGERSRRFEYLAVSPRPDELLAILADGTALLLPRPVNDADDGSEVASIALGPDAESATLTLVSGREVSLRAVGGSPSSRPPAAGIAGGYPANLAGALGAGNSGGVAAAAVNGSATAIAIDGVRLGARLRELRVAAGLTQAELARRTGIHRPNIARVEAGRHTPSLETLARLASAIGVPTTTVLAE
jgi:DNA-binding XRE family transcriptional regulator